MNDIAWNHFGKDFTWDGSWRDIYVLNASPADWQCTVDMLRGYDCSYVIDGEARELPLRIEDLFAERLSGTATLWFELAGIELNCHFFDPNEIEFDLDPRTVNAGNIDRLTDFLRQLGNTLSKSTFLTAENERQAVILRYDPETRQLYWIAPSGDALPYK